MSTANARLMTGPMLMNAVVQAERHAFDKRVSPDWLKKHMAPNKLHLATIVEPNNQSGRILIPHHRVEVRMYQAHVPLNRKFVLDLSIDAWEMLIPVEQAQLVIRELQMYPYLYPSHVGTTE